MKHTKSIVASVLLVSAFAATSVFAANSSMGMKLKMGKGNQFSNTGVIQLLTAKGITPPTLVEVKAFETKMKALQKAEKSLSTDAKAQLETLRQSFRKQEREFYRTQGVVLPTEDEIAKMETIRDLLKPSTGSGSKGLMDQFGMKRGQGMGSDNHGGPEGMGQGQDMQDQGPDNRGGMMGGSGGLTGPREQMQGGPRGKMMNQGGGREGMRGGKNGRNKNQTAPTGTPNNEAETEN